MNKPEDRNQQLSIVVDKKHGTTYHINSNGRSYITNTNQFSGKGENKR